MIRRCYTYRELGSNAVFTTDYYSEGFIAYKRANNLPLGWWKKEKRWYLENATPERIMLITNALDIFFSQEISISPIPIQSDADRKRAEQYLNKMTKQVRTNQANPLLKCPQCRYIRRACRCDI